MGDKAKKAIIIVISVVGIASIVAGVFYYRQLRGIWPVVLGPREDISNLLPPSSSSLVATTSREAASTSPPSTYVQAGPLRLLSGFEISIFAKNLAGARVMTVDSFDNIWVSQTSQGQISIIEYSTTLGYHTPRFIYTGLQNPHGLAFDPSDPTVLYIAEEHRITRSRTQSEKDDDHLQSVVELPSGGGHYTRTLGFGPDGKLYVAIGSSCNVCEESDARRASVYTMNADGTDFRLFAKGLRNSVFFTWSPYDNKMWATEMGRDLIGDDVPPDEINIIKDGGNYGWPICYGKNIHDTDYDKRTYIRNPCLESFETPSHIDLQAHSAPLGLAFIPKAVGWPKEYEGDLLVAFHGSWNRSVPTGYKVVRVKLDEQGNYIGIEDFITGYLGSAKIASGAIGRPAHMLFLKNGALLISDDKAGVIYKVLPKM